MPHNYTKYEILSIKNGDYFYVQGVHQIWEEKKVIRNQTGQPTDENYQCLMFI